MIYTSLLLLALSITLVWLQDHRLRISARHIAHLESRVEGQRQRIDVLEAAVAVEQEYAKLLVDELAGTERRADQLAHCVRRIVEATPKATLYTALVGRRDASLN